MLLACDSKQVSVAFYSLFCNIHQSGVLTVLIHHYIIEPHETAAISACFVYTLQPCVMLCHFMQSRIQRVHVCLAVTCHQQFWQNDQDFFYMLL